MPFQQLPELLGLLDRGGADQHRLQLDAGVVDLAHHRLQLLGAAAIDLVVLVLSRHRTVGRNFDDSELVDLGEFVGLGRGRAGHAGELLVEAEIILEGDGGERDVFRLDRHALLGFQGLMQPFGIASPRHHAAGEFVDDHHLVVADDIFLVLLEQLMRAQRLIHVVYQRRVGRLVERAFLHDAGRAQQRLGVLVAAFGQVHRALLFVDVIILADQLRNQRVHADIEARAILRRTGNDQRRARLVDQDGIDLVDDGEFVPALDHLRHVVFHVVAQVVEAEFVVGAIGDVGGVGLPPLVVVQSMHDDADAHAEKAVNLSHPLGVAAGEIIVDRHDVDAFAGKRVQIDCQGGDQGLAFAGAHLRDGAFVQDHAADQLHIEMPLLQRALGCLAHRGERGSKQFVEALAGGDFGAEGHGLGAQLLVAQGRELGLERVDRGYFRPIALEPAVVRRAEYFLE